MDLPIQQIQTLEVSNFDLPARILFAMLYLIPHQVFAQLGQCRLLQLFYLRKIISQ